MSLTPYSSLSCYLQCSAVGSSELMGGKFPWNLPLVRYCRVHFCLLQQLFWTSRPYPQMSSLLSLHKHSPGYIPAPFVPWSLSHEEPSVQAESPAAPMHSYHGEVAREHTLNKKSPSSTGVRRNFQFLATSATHILHFTLSGDGIVLSIGVIEAPTGH